MNALIVSLVCLMPMAGEPPTEPADAATNTELPNNDPPSRLRVWTDSTGKQQVELEFMRLKDGVVYFKRSNGKISTVMPDRLSKADRAWLWENTTSDGRFRWEAGYSPAPVVDQPKRTLRTECRPLATTLSTGDPIRFTLHWSRAWYTPASGSEPARYRRISCSEVPIKQLATLKSLKLHFRTPADREYHLEADIINHVAAQPLSHRNCAALFLTMTEEGLSEAAHMRGKWMSGTIAGFHAAGRFSIQVEGTFVPSWHEDAPLPFKTDPFHIERVEDGRKTLAEIEAIARAKVSELSGVDQPRGLPGRGVPIPVIELENGNRQVGYTVPSYRIFGVDWHTVEVTPQGTPVQVNAWSYHALSRQKIFRRLCRRPLDGETVWPKPTADD